MAKITKARKRELRAATLVYVSEKLAGHTSAIDVPGAAAEEQEFVADELLAIRCDLLNQAQRLREKNNAVPYNRNIADGHRPGIAEIREELRRAGIQEELIDGQAKQLWQDRQRAGQLGGAE